MSMNMNMNMNIDIDEEMDLITAQFYDDFSMPTIARELKLVK
jgi:hypothetical protein